VIFNEISNQFFFLSRDNLKKTSIFLGTHLSRENFEKQATPFFFPSRRITRCAFLSRDSSKN
jgi:hypothetical protein